MHNLTGLESTHAALAALAPDAHFSQIVLYETSALAVVLLSLAALWFLCEFAAAAFRLLPATAKARMAPPTAPESEGPAAISAVTAGELDPILAAVIAAAVDTTLGKDYRVVGIRKIAPAPGNLLAAWTMQGRIQHHTSHALR